MILVIAGTRDGRELAVRLADAGQEVMVSVISEYGGQLAKHPGVRVQVGALDEGGLCAVIRQHGISHIVDASHPYAAGISANAINAAAAAGAAYLRFERPATPLPSYHRLHIAADAKQAAQIAAKLGSTVFLTTGSRTLGAFKHEPALKDCRVIARVLPEPDVLRECLELGFCPKDIVAVQGPFSLALNREMFRFFQADVIVTKNAGSIGGADTKIQAAMELGLSIIVIDRPHIAYPCVFHSLEQVVSYFQEESPCNI